MTNLNSICYDLISTIKGSARFSDDNTISISQIEYLVINNRSLLIRRDLTKGRAISDNITQILPCIPVIQVDSSECSCNVPSDCTILRTKDKMPTPIEIYNQDLITRVSGVDVQGRGWSIISYARASVSGLNSWTAKSPKAFFHNGYIYIINAPIVKYISVSLVAEDPREASVLSTCSGAPCYTNDMDFPISNYMLPLLKEMILKDLKIEVSVPSDFKGDERNKTEPQSNS